MPVALSCTCWKRLLSLYEGWLWWFQHTTFQILWPITFHSQPFFYLSHPISQIQQKLWNLCILFVLNHDISHSIVISTIFAGHIEFSSDGKGIDWQFLRFDYLYVSRAQEHILNHLRPMCLARDGGGGHIMLPVTRPETITIRHHPSGNNSCYQ